MTIDKFALFRHHLIVTYYSRLVALLSPSIYIYTEADEYDTCTINFVILIHLHIRWGRKGGYKLYIGLCAY